MGISLDQIFSWPNHVINLYQLYWDIEPWGTHADDSRCAFAAVAAANSMSKKPQPLKNLMPDWWKADTPTNWQDGFEAAVKFGEKHK